MHPRQCTRANKVGGLVFLKSTFSVFLCFKLKCLRFVAPKNLRNDIGQWIRHVPCAGTARLVLCVVAIFVTLFSSAVRLEAADFAVAGNIVITHFDNQGKAIESGVIKRDFKMSVHDNQWLMDVADVTEGSSHVCGSDGTNTYWLFLSGNPAVSIPAVVVKGDYPLAANNILVTLPWWVFGSSIGLEAAQSHSNSIPVPWAFPRMDPEAYIYSREIVKNPSVPGLPEEITFRVSKDLLKTAGKSGVLNNDPASQSVLDRNRLNLDSFKPGFIGGTYKVTEHTNWDQMVLPLRAEMVRYALAGGPFERYDLNVESVSHSTIMSGVPELKGTVSVTDQRFRSQPARIDSINYLVTDNKWRSDEDSDLQKQFVRLTKASLASQPIIVGPSSKVLARVLLVAVLVLPVVFILLRKRTKR